MKIEEDLQKALMRMPAKDKDKLLLRLVAKDQLLVKKLTFELLDKKGNTEERMRDIQKEIESTLIRASGEGQTPGYLLMDFRSCNPLITEHVKVTKDKFGEVYLTLFMLRKGLELNCELLKRFKTNRFDTLAPYVARRLEQVFARIEKMHEDYHLEFRADLKAILTLIYSIPPFVPWAERLEIPQESPF